MPDSEKSKKGRVGTIARRTFLIGSAAVAGGVAFGTFKFKAPHPNPLHESLGPGESAITPFVKIDSSGVTLITPRADKGQGAYSIQAHLIAEELDIDPHTVRLSPGLPAPAYYNGAVLAEGSPFPSHDESWVAERVRGFLEVPSKWIGMQMTGGSSTVPDGFERLRTAGCVARETLKAAASQQTGVPRSELFTENGEVVTPAGERIPYTRLAEVAATVEPVTDVTLRPESEWKLLGKETLRTDIVAKSTGTMEYGIDLSLEGMVYAAVRTNPGIGGAVESYDASAAEAMSGSRFRMASA